MRIQGIFAEILNLISALLVKQQQLQYLKMRKTWGNDIRFSGVTGRQHDLVNVVLLMRWCMHGSMGSAMLLVYIYVFRIMILEHPVVSLRRERLDMESEKHTWQEKLVICLLLPSRHGSKGSVSWVYNLKISGIEANLLCFLDVFLT